MTAGDLSAAVSDPSVLAHPQRHWGTDRGLEAGRRGGNSPPAQTFPRSFPPLLLPLPGAAEGSLRTDGSATVLLGRQGFLKGGSAKLGRL